MATSLEESEKVDLIKKLYANTFHLVQKIVKVGPVDTELALLQVKKEEINASKFAERAKLRKVKYIVRSATYPSGLKKGRGRAHVTHFACVTVDLEKFCHGTPLTVNNAVDHGSVSHT